MMLVRVLVFAWVAAWFPALVWGQQKQDFLAKLQKRAIELNQADWMHWGTRPGVYSGHTSHSNRLIPVYTWGITLDSIQGSKSIYRDAERLKSTYGFVPKQTLNPDAEYFDQTQLYHLQKQAFAAGKKNIILFVFDGMDWETTRAAAIYKTKSVGFTQGKGLGLSFLDYQPAHSQIDYGYCVTSPHNGKTKTDVNSQTVVGFDSERLGGYSAKLGAETPWSHVGDERYLLGKRPDVPHPYTDSAASATSLNSGIKTYNDSINVDIEGNHVIPLAHEFQKAGKAIGVVSSVPVSHATPACVYANNVKRSDYQDITRDMIGLKSAAHRETPLSGVDVLIGGGWGVFKKDDRTSQGMNYVPGNKYASEKDIRKIDTRAGGKYTVVERTAGKSGAKILKEAAETAVQNGTRLFGFFGGEAGHLPYQTADGRFDPVPGVSSHEKYSPADISENPTLADFAAAALKVLGQNENGFYLSIEAGDVDWANHNNNVDDSIGAVFSGEKAFDTIVQWVETNSDWDETCLILTADHGHFMVIDQPEVLAGIQKPESDEVFAQKMAAKRAEKLAAIARKNKKLDQKAMDAGGVADNFQSSHPCRKALRGDWQYDSNIASCTADPELFKKYKNHGPILRYPVKFQDGMIEFEVQGKGVKKLVLTLNEKGHVFRMIHLDDKSSRIIGWSGPSKTTDSETIGKKDVPSAASFSDDWVPVKIVIKEDSAIINAGKYYEIVRHDSLRRPKTEFTLSFHEGKLQVRNFRLTPSVQ
ncbi:MAG: alkaline phosphatase [Planctomycetota bacterium]